MHTKYINVVQQLSMWCNTLVFHEKCAAGVSFIRRVIKECDTPHKQHDVPCQLFRGLCWADQEGQWLDFSTGYIHILHLYFHNKPANQDRLFSSWVSSFKGNLQVNSLSHTCWLSSNLFCLHVPFAGKKTYLKPKWLDESQLVWLEGRNYLFPIHKKKKQKTPYWLIER